MDKILQSMGRGQGITITNDGATILKSIYVDNPAAKVCGIQRGGWGEVEPPALRKTAPPAIKTSFSIAS